MKFFKYRGVIIKKAKFDFLYIHNMDILSVSLENIPEAKEDLAAKEKDYEEVGVYTPGEEEGEEGEMGEEGGAEE